MESRALDGLQAVNLAILPLLATTYALRPEPHRCGGGNALPGAVIGKI